MGIYMTHALKEIKNDSKKACEETLGRRGRTENQMRGYYCVREKVGRPRRLTSFSLIKNIRAAGETV